MALANVHTDVDVAIVGAGVVGLATAAVLATAGTQVVVLEQHARVGQETSSRNSGVIHAGLYHPSGTLKATTCVRGRQLLYARATRDGIEHRRTGKLIVAVEERERATLDELYTRGLENGGGALRLLDANELRAREPRIAALAALWSPETGIVDAHQLMRSYAAQAQRHGADLGVHLQVTAIEPLSGRYRITTTSADGQREHLTARRVVNAAGLHAHAVAKLVGLSPETLGVRLHYCKGDYFGLAARWRGACQHLIYPLPDAAGLGVHLTLDLASNLHAGPDATYVDALDYHVDPNKRARFAQALRRYLPELRDEDLTADYAGIRPKLYGPAQRFADFVIEDAARHGLPGFINLLGIESPGLTASEAIAERVQALLPS